MSKAKYGTEKDHPDSKVLKFCCAFEFNNIQKLALEFLFVCNEMGPRFAQCIMDVCIPLMGGF